MRGYGLDSLEEDPELSAIARFAAQLCDTPVALVNLVETERQRFLAHEGLPIAGYWIVVVACRSDFRCNLFARCAPLAKAGAAERIDHARYP